MRGPIRPISIMAYFKLIFTLGKTYEKKIRYRVKMLSFFEVLVAQSFAQETAKDEDSEAVKNTVSCYTCGNNDDPEADELGSYGDAEKGAAEGKKMYNHTCDIADRLGKSDRWMRKCPEGTRSCAWANVKWNGQSKIKKRTRRLHTCTEAVKWKLVQ